MSQGIQKVEFKTVAAEKWAVGTLGFAVIAFAIEFAAIVLVAVASGILYHQVAYGYWGSIDTFFTVGSATALFYTLPFAYRDEYAIEKFLEGQRATSRIFVVWNYAFLGLALIGFLTKTTEVYSRGWLILLYVSGLLGVIVADGLIDAVLRKAIARGHVQRRRLMLVGGAEEIAACNREIAAAQTSARVVATGVLPGPGAAGDMRDVDLILADLVATARAARVEDIVVLLDWAQAGRIERIVENLSVLPVGIHVGAGSVIGRFADPKIARFGGTTALSLTYAPLHPMQTLAKRSFDLLVSGIALFLLSPLFLLIAMLIKRDTEGPVFFRQRRRGFNHEEFRIWKFRTMTTMEDGAEVAQARRGDLRVTRVGRWLRRLNLDELPQLLNVLSGEMSLVGPRPHAVAHDIHYETRINDYPRRLNVKPGITGWAQVHGFRGATETEDDMRRRVEYDIYYIENWSLVLDLYILVLTLASPKAYRNAY